LPPQIFERARVSLDMARMETVTRAGGPPIPSSVQIPFSAITQRLLLAATGEANRLGHETIGIGHLLLAMLEHPESSEGLLLARWGISAERVRRGIADMLGGESN
jgi:ATP-dependent Clp protease ATP-binding subunit ClpA